MHPEVIADVVASMLGDGFEVRGAPSPDADPEWLASTQAILAAIVGVEAGHIEAASHLRFIQAPSHGFDHIDIEAAAARGIPVANVGSSGAEAATVAEHAFGLMLACAKKLIDGHSALREGRWATQELLQMGLSDLHAKTLGIVGLGHIGREVATRARAFGMDVVYADPVAEAEPGLKRVELDELLRTADVVTVHVPLLPSTRALIGERELSLLKPRAILVNTSRGPVVDNEALAEALHAGRVIAGIDVFDPEPPPADHPLLRAPNIVLSPHVAGVTGESVRRIMAEAIENLKRFAAGERPRDVVNGA
jgi:phosphoglycerate dehydrogenase-like enzyme